MWLDFLIETSLSMVYVFYSDLIVYFSNFPVKIEHKKANIDGKYQQTSAASGAEFCAIDL